MDKTNFQLSEQVKDLKYQLKHQLSEHSKLQENSTSRISKDLLFLYHCQFAKQKSFIAEYEEKLKRMRGI